ncbi:E3 ubiquitin-protein ligase CCNB1IP1-like [Cimex lectularius]|uniref:RING-type domain-containing protein n=1 Tax=Cimex lectularius TaxID=79782 RepID=A0A8I6RMN2_CIMLE|nr:E3 ubiquitin-protein ligase CCNB1IP1-like [Cimex lectularius]
MTEEFMCCNFDECLTPITKVGWITRCSHVFCKHHGERSLAKNSSQVKCPSCDEVLNRQNDVSKFNTNPSDLIVCCVRPEKALEYASRAAKLWCYQMKVKRKIQLHNVTDKYDKMAYDATIQLQLENKELREFVSNVEKELEKVNDELLLTKQKLKKYKAAYDNCRREKYRPMIRKKDAFEFLQRPSQSIGEMCSQTSVKSPFFKHL